MIVKTVHIDADILCYELAGLKDDDNPDDPIGTVDLEEVVHWKIKNILQATGCLAYKMYLTGKGNFRNDIATIQPYKGNRKDTEKPYHYQFLRELFIEEYHAEVIDGMEADDALAMAITANPRGTVLASRDKDLLQVSGWHYSWGTRLSPEKPLRFISEEEGLIMLYTQMLTGDRVDNIKGLSGTKGKPGIGPAKAKKILKGLVEEEDLWDAVLKQYQKKYTCKRQAHFYLVENARLLYMLRKEGDEWKPPYMR